ncbi:MAG: hypothetical protein EA385_17450, partial [Salinarimonadaceae bacterium]
ISNWEPITAFMADLWDRVIEGIKARFRDLIAWFTGLPGMIMDAIGSIDLSNIISWPSLPSWMGGGAPAAAGAPAAPVNDNAAATSASEFDRIARSLDDTRRASTGAPGESLRPQRQEVGVGGEIVVKVEGPGTVTSVRNENRDVRITAPDRGMSLGVP